MAIYAPIVILVGGTATGKTHFYCKYGVTAYHFPTIKCGVRICPYMDGMPIMVDTPGLLEHRDHDDYSWQGYFYFADLIVNFGNWDEKEVYGVKRRDIPVIQYSGDADTTMNQIVQFFKNRSLGSS
jgi:hypothetical protein